jgi:Transposase DDE domain group 1
MDLTRRGTDTMRPAPGRRCSSSGSRFGQAETLDHTDRVVLDMDSSESPVHGQQEGSAYNGHFETVCYHPLFLFNDHGDCVAAKLRPGNVSSGDDWEELLVPEIDRQQAEHQRVAFRADAAFARPAIYEGGHYRRR